MTNTASKLPTLESVRVSDLRSYLVNRGWTVQPFPQQEVLKIAAPANVASGFDMLIPASESLRDYLVRVEEVLSSLSKLEDRLATDVLRDVLAPTCDKLHVRLSTAETRSGTMMLGFATHFIDNLRSLLTFAACAEMDPRRYFRRALKDGIGFANRCRLAGTSAGSFQITVETPLVPPASKMQKEMKVYPIERRIVTGLMETLTGIRQAADVGDADAVLAEGSEVRVNANICDALLGMKPEADDALLDINVSLSHSWPVEQSAFPQPVRFEGKAFETVSAIGQALRNQEELAAKQWTGRVVRLSADDPSTGEDGALLVTIRIDSLARPVRAEFHVNPDQYRQAVQAHLDNRQVSVHGILERTARKATLVEVSNFKVVD